MCSKALPLCWTRALLAKWRGKGETSHRFLIECDVEIKWQLMQTHPGVYKSSLLQAKSRSQESVVVLGQVLGRQNWEQIPAQLLDLLLLLCPQLLLLSVAKEMRESRAE